MAYTKERVKGRFKGQTIVFNRNWSGHRFTDDEVKQLLKGETIHITAHSNSKDKDFDCDGNLQKQEYNGNVFYGFKSIAKDSKEKAEGLFNGEKISFNRSWGNHRFTDDEVARLLKGETIHITAHSNSKDKDFDCDGNLQRQEYKGKSFYGFKMLENQIKTDSFMDDDADDFTTPDNEPAADSASSSSSSDSSSIGDIFDLN